MKRHQRYVLSFVLAIGLYVGLLAALNHPERRPVLLSFVQLADTESNVEKVRFIVRAMPWYGLISLGCYCLYRLGMDLLNYRDRPDEIPKLAEVKRLFLDYHESCLFDREHNSTQDVKRAREDLQRRGFKGTN